MGPLRPSCGEVALVAEGSVSRAAQLTAVNVNRKRGQERGSPSKEERANGEGG